MTTLEFHIDGLIIADSDISAELAGKLTNALELVLAGRYEVSDLHILVKPTND